MFVSSGRGSWPAGLAVLGLAVPAGATDPNRMLLLAAEAASATQAPTLVGGGSPWLWAGVIAGTLFASFAGAYLGLRQFSIQHVRADGDWREVTYRFRAKGPLKFGTDMVEHLHSAVSDLDRLTPKRRSERRSAEDSAPHPEPASTVDDAASSSLAAPTPVVTAKEDRAEAYQRARRLLAEGQDVWTVRELTGLKFAELDLLTSATGEIPPTTPESVGANS